MGILSNLMYYDEKVNKIYRVVCMLSVLAGCVDDKTIDEFKGVESGHDRGVTRAVFCIVI